MGTIVIAKKENGKYKYTYNNRKGNTIFTSSTLDSVDQCRSEINILKKQFVHIDIVQVKVASGKMYFKLFLNQFALGQSRKFTTPLLIEKGIADFKKNFVNSEILDFTENIFKTLETISEER